MTYNLLDKEAKHPCDRQVYAEHMSAFVLELWKVGSRWLLPATVTHNEILFSVKCKVAVTERIIYCSLGNRVKLSFSCYDQDFFKIATTLEEEISNAKPEHIFSEVSPTELNRN